MSSVRLLQIKLCPETLKYFFHHSLYLHNMQYTSSVFRFRLYQSRIPALSLNRSPEQLTEHQTARSYLTMLLLGLHTKMDKIKL